MTSSVESASLKYVHIISHSHCDPGWLETFEQYYSRRVKRIISNVVTELNKNGDRKFVWSETSYFERWWNDAGVSQSLKDSFRRHLTKTKQMEFVNGGWVQQDEGNPDLSQSINQLTTGHRFLQDTFNYVPRIAWQIDPFGHSASFGALAALAGFEALVINRIPFDVKNGFKVGKHMEFVWNTTNVGAGHLTEMFTHVLHTHYSAPQGFDWEERAPTIVGNSRMLPTRARVFINMMKTRANAYRTSHLLVPFGDDFKFVQASKQFSNMDALIKEINGNPKRYENIKVHYSTLSEYFDAIRRDDSKVEFPVHHSDFFPYADNGDSYWSGYLTTRPALKKLSRQLESRRRGAEIMQAILGPSDFAFPQLENARRQSGIMMHHDAITGTCKVRVMNDYMVRMKNAFNDVDMVLRRLLERAVKLKPLNPLTTFKSSSYVTVFNSLAWSRVELVRIKVQHEQVRIVAPDGSSVPVQVRPSWRFGIGVRNDEYEAVFFANVPPVSVAVYQVVVGKANAKSDSMPLLNVLRRDGRGGGRVRGDTSDRIKVIPTSDTSEQVVENKVWRIVVSRESGLMASVEHLPSKTRIPMKQSFYQYKTQRSGAYLFRPQGHSSPIGPSGIQEIVIQRGPLVSTVWARHAGFDIEYSVFHTNTELQEEIHQVVHVKASPNQEVTLHHKFDRPITLSTHDGVAFHKRREQPVRQLAANFYPMIGGAVVSLDKDHHLSVVNEHSMAVGNAQNDLMEIMVHRSLSRDDGRGMSEAMVDSSTARVELWWSFHPIRISTVRHSGKLVRLNNPLVVLRGPPTSASAVDAPSMQPEHAPPSTPKPKPTPRAQKQRQQQPTPPPTSNSKKTSSSDATNWANVFKEHGGRLSVTRRVACVNALTKMEATIEDGKSLLESSTLIEGGITKWRTRQDIRTVLRRVFNSVGGRRLLAHGKKRRNDDDASERRMLFAPLGTTSYPPDVHLLSLFTLDPKSDEAAFRVQSLGVDSELDVDAVLMFAPESGVSVTRVQPYTLAFQHRLQPRQYVLERPTYAISKKRDIDVSIQHLAGKGGAVTDRQNTDEEGVFISAAAREEEALEKRGGSRRLLAATTTTPTQFQLDGLQIRSFKMSLRRQQDKVAGVRYVPPKNAVADTSAFDNHIVQRPPIKQHTERKIHVEVQKGVSVTLVFIAVVSSCVIGACIISMLFHVAITQKQNKAL